MFVKLILPALLEAKDPGFRPIKYALFPPLGLAALAGYLDDEDQVVLEDEHVMPLTTDDRPDLVVMSVDITSAYRADQLADHYRRRGSHVALGGLHVTALPDEAARHADTVFLGPGEDTWPRFLADFRRGAPLARYGSQERTLLGAPPLRRDLIDRRRYLCPNSLVVSRGVRTIASLLQGRLLSGWQVVLHPSRRRGDRAGRRGRHAQRVHRL